MKVLIVSFFAEKHLTASAAQNTRFLASGLLERDHEVKVICAGSDTDTIIQDGYLLSKIEEARTGNHKWLGKWRPYGRLYKKAEDLFDDWSPNVIYISAWGGLLEFALVGLEKGIPVVQMVHDYSILCLRTWLIDSWGNLCSGPTSLAKCTKCVNHSLTWKTRVRDQLVSLPVISKLARKFIKRLQNAETHNNQVVAEAYSYIKQYRQQVSLFIAQSPSVVEILQSGGVEPERCRFVPQYIGEEKLRPYPRSEGFPGKDRPFRYVYLGRWSSEKGTDLLLEAFIAADLPRPSTLWVISQNAQQAAIEDAVTDRLPVGRTIEVFNGLAGKAVAQKLAQADAAVVPSTCMELASRVVLEAHAQGVPVIASSTVGNRYVIEDGKNGLIFPSGDQLALQHALEQVVETPEVLADWSQKLSEPIGRDEWIGRTTSVLQEVIQQRVSLAK